MRGLEPESVMDLKANGQVHVNESNPSPVVADGMEVAGGSYW